MASWWLIAPLLQLANPAPLDLAATSTPQTAEMQLRLSHAFMAERYMESTQHSTDPESLLALAPKRLATDDWEALDLGYATAASLVVIVPASAGADSTPVGVQTTIAGVAMVDTAAAPTLREGFALTLRDLGSNLRLERLTDAGRVRVWFFPIDANRLHFGFSRGPAWGDSQIGTWSNWTPGIKLAYLTEGSYVSFGAKMAKPKESLATEQYDRYRTMLPNFYSAFAGAGAAVTPQFHIDAMVGAAAWGRAEYQKERPRTTLGSSVQLSFCSDGCGRLAVELHPISQDTWWTDSLTSVAPRSPGTHYLIDGEYTHLWSEAGGSEAAEWNMANAGDLSVRFRSYAWQFGFLTTYRSLPYLLVGPFSHHDFGSYSMDTSHPELSATVSVDYLAASSNVRLGAAFVALRPAYTRQTTDYHNYVTGELDVTSQEPAHTFRGQHGEHELVVANDVSSIAQTKLHLAWQLNEHLVTAVEWLAEFDRNASGVVTYNDRYRSSSADGETGITRRNAVNLLVHGSF